MLEAISTMPSALAFVPMLSTYELDTSKDRPYPEEIAGTQAMPPDWVDCRVAT
jgi:hypothetical protein